MELESGSVSEQLRDDKGEGGTEHGAVQKNCVVVHKSVAIKINWKMQR